MATKERSDRLRDLLSKLPESAIAAVQDALEVGRKDALFEENPASMRRKIELALLEVFEASLGARRKSDWVSNRLMASGLVSFPSSASDDHVRSLLETHPTAVSVSLSRAAVFSEVLEKTLELYRSLFPLVGERDLSGTRKRWELKTAAADRIGEFWDPAAVLAYAGRYVAVLDANLFLDGTPIGPEDLRAFYDPELETAVDPGESFPAIFFVAPRGMWGATDARS